MQDGPRHVWKPGDHLTHRFNPGLGIGRVIAVEGRAVVVEFSSSATLRLSTVSDALIPADLQSGQAAPEDEPVERLARGDVDAAEDFLNRVNLLHLLSIREGGGIGSFLGGRVRLFPHQLYVAERATATDPVRWLLADEVGLGKTIEACLILNRLVHSGRVSRCLVVAPESLTVQWLGELWRKYHQVFTLLDEPRLADVERDFGPRFNPFDVHRRAVIALEALVDRPHLTDQAVAAGIDLLVVDEAQRLRRPPGHPGGKQWRAVAPIAGLGRHVLLLSATPLDDDAHGFFRLLQLLRPEEFPEEQSFEARLASGMPLPPCTSSTRRSDIGGLPPRVGIPIAIDDGFGWKLRRQMEATMRSAEAPHAVARRHKIDRIRRGLASGAALSALLGPEERTLRQQADAMDAVDPRLLWLLAQARRWNAAGEKTLVFAAHRETLDMLRAALAQRAHLASGIFHEELPAARRDLEVARFRETHGPSLLVSTECGGEGRNFEFCRRIVLFDLPWRPSVVEQRIGRLDRIGRLIPVDIVYFRPPGGIGLDAVRLFETLGLFREPVSGLEPHLTHVEDAIEAVALDPQATLSEPRLTAIVSEAQAARNRVREAAYQQLHRDPYRADMAAGILARVPPDLDALNEQVVTTACGRLGFSIERPRGRRTYAIELGNEALVDSLPGVPGGSTYVGSFDREQAVEDETLDFFASGHPLVEGVFAHLEDTAIGRVAYLEIELRGERGEGLVALYKDGPVIDIVALDSAGRPRPAWTAAFRQRPLRVRAVSDIAARDWMLTARRLGAMLEPSRPPYALAAIVVRPIT